jgi:hypothetical protein
MEGSGGIFTPSGGLGSIGEAGSTVFVQSELAEDGIKAKFDSLGGSPGDPLVPGREGLIDVPGGTRRDYSRGSIYRRTGDQSQPAFFVDLSTNQRYDQLGGPGGFLGFPVSDFEPDPDDLSSGVTKFESGAIYFFPDVGAFEMRDIALRFVGFHCFGETDEFSAADEPFLTFGVVPTVTEQSQTLQTRIFEDVDSGESRGTLIELYRGLPFGAAISVTLAEHDQGDPNKYREIVKKGVDKGSEATVAVIAEIPVVGTFLSVVAGVVLEVTKPAITDALNELVGTADDHIGTVVMPVTPKDMLTLTRAERRDFEGIQAHLESPLIAGDGSSYKAYFDIEVV